MIKQKCSRCGSDTAFVKAFLASKVLPAYCNHCSIKLTRKHTISSSLMFVGFSVGLFVLLFLFLSHGMNMVASAFTLFILMMVVAYVSELFIFDLVEYSEAEEKRSINKSLRNALIGIFVILLGAVLYIFDL